MQIAVEPPRWAAPIHSTVWCQVHLPNGLWLLPDNHGKEQVGQDQNALGRAIHRRSTTCHFPPSMQHDFAVVKDLMQRASELYGCTHCGGHELTRHLPCKPARRLEPGTVTGHD